MGTDYYNRGSGTEGSLVDTDYNGVFGNKFTVSAPVTISALWWYCYDTAKVPASLRLYNADTNALIVEVTPSAPASVGYKEHAVTGVSLVTGVNYLIGVSSAGGSGYHFKGWTTAPPALNSPFSHVGVRYGGWVPAAVSGYELLSIGVTTGAVFSGGEGDSGGSTGAGVPVQTGDLEAWLSSDGAKQLHEDDGLPWLTYQEVTDGDHGLAAIAANIGAIMGAGWSSATDTLHQIGSKVASILTKVTDGPLPGIAGLEALANTILETLEAAAQFLINPTGGGAGALANNPPVPGAGWAMVGEADFDDCDVITVQCHLIVLDFSSFPVSRPAHNICGVPIRYRLGWWCPMNGDFAGARQFIDFEKMHVQDGGRLMNGALIVCEPGTSGHWQAWLLS